MYVVGRNYCSQDRRIDSRRITGSASEGRWTCPECRCSNPFDSEYCNECRFEKWRLEKTRHDRNRYASCDRPRSPLYDRDGRSRFPSQRRSDRRDDPHAPREKVSREWPPSFESSGASYIFDARSGFFYEATSNFFYDPKTKLYYSNKKQAYFEFVKDQDPPFKPFSREKKIISESNSKENQSDVRSSSVENQKTEKKKIAICLKSKPGSNEEKKDFKITTIKKPKVEPKELPSNPEIILSKKDASNIEKWSERARESNHVMAQNVIEEKTCPDVVSKDIIKSKTTHGKPVCLLCKRKFANQEKLDQHIEKSSLHKSNLEKKEEYRDRARERRDMYGMETLEENEKHIQAPSLTQARKVDVTDVVAPENLLKDESIGKNMLQKLGWNEGESIGRKPLSAEHTLLWKNIEAVASGKKSKSLSVCGVGKST